MTDNEKFSGGGPVGLNLTRVPRIIHGEGSWYNFQGHNVNMSLTLN